MNTKIVERDSFYICGYAVETNLEENDNDISKLYEQFQNNGSDSILKQLPLCGKGYYGLEWYTSGHNSFFYLLGRSVDEAAVPPKGAEIKRIPAAKYIVTGIPSGTNLVDAWTEFFYKAIPDLGYEVDVEHGFYFEYYPANLSGECELWTPIK